MNHMQEPEETSWYHRIQQSWIVNAIVIPMAISLICNVILHWMR